MKLEKLIARLKDIQSRIHFQCLKEGFKREDDEDILFQIISLLQSTQAKLPEFKVYREPEGSGRVYYEHDIHFERVKAFNQALDQITPLFLKQEAEKGELKDRIKNREEMIDSLEKAYLRLKDSYKSLQQKLNEAQEEIKALKEWGEEWKNSYQKVLDKLSTAEAELAEIREKVKNIAEKLPVPDWTEMITITDKTKVEITPANAEYTFNTYLRLLAQSISQEILGGNNVL